MVSEFTKLMHPELDQDNRINKYLAKTTIDIFLQGIQPKGIVVKSGLRSTVLLLTLSLFLSLFTVAIAETRLLNKIEVTGNSKTTTKAILINSGVSLGEEIDDHKLVMIEENLRRHHQFNLKKINFKDGILYLEIEDKWSLFPVPMITQSGNYYYRGGLIYDNNFLGSMGTMAIGAATTNSGFNVLVYYQDETFFTNNSGFKLLLLKKSDLVEFRREHNIKNSFESRLSTILFTPNYLYKNHVFKGGPIYIKKEVYTSDGQRQFYKNGTGLFFRHHLNAYKTLDIQYDGTVTTYNFSLLRDKNGHNNYLHEAWIDNCFPVGRNFVNLNIFGHYSNDDMYLASKLLGGQDGLRGYDRSSTPAQYNYGFLAQYQQHLFHRIFVSPFYEYNGIKLIKPIMNGALLKEHTVGLGARYYFKKISIPAIILDMARNINDKSFHYHLNIGLSL
ncbi:MAG: hypothetical protein HQK50_11935 [Oligoflexia bacterium]|nr:hypothetical protein [Oligoflexia bacterium]MBF0366274.1 hypothetical protein [Oligoflexia bacterium]